MCEKKRLERCVGGIKRGTGKKGRRRMGRHAGREYSGEMGGEAGRERC